jgi:hypothetical protein
MNWASKKKFMIWTNFYFRELWKSWKFTNCKKFMNWKKFMNCQFIKGTSAEIIPIDCCSETWYQIRILHHF